MSLYLALVNATKFPDSDMANYLQSFVDAQQLDLVTYLQLNTREPLYYLSLYGVSRLPGADAKLYIFLSTFIPYLIYGSAVLRLGAALHVDRKSLLSLLIFLFFIPQLFSLSAHLLRQFLAASLVMLFLSDYAVIGRRRWGVGMLGVMIHYSTMPLVLQTFLQPFRGRSGVSNAVFYVVALFVVYTLAVQVAPIFLDVPVLGMVFGRIANGKGADLQPLTLPALVTVFSLLGMSFFCLANNNGKILGVQGWPVLFCTVIVCVIVLISSTQPTLSEIALRYFFYLYFLSGLVLVVLMLRIPMIGTIVHALALLSLPMFFYKLAYGEWAFAPVELLLFESAWMLWGYQAFI